MAHAYAKTSLPDLASSSNGEEKVMKQLERAYDNVVKAETASNFCAHWNAVTRHAVTACSSD